MVCAVLHNISLELNDHDDFAEEEPYEDVPQDQQLGDGPGQAALQAFIIRHFSH